MANHKLDMGKAWTQATGLIGANRDTISAIAGLFFFLPTLALALFAPELANPEPMAAPNGNPQAAMQAMIDQMAQAYADNWLLFAAMTLAQFVGSLSLLALLTDRARPTVRDALTSGLRSLASYMGAQLLSALGVALAFGIPLGLVAAAGSPIATVLFGIVLGIVGLYVFIKLSLIAPVIAIDGALNPITALARSWRLTKGNSVRIAAFLALLLVTIGIIAALVTGIVGLVLSALGAQVASLGNAVVSAVINTGIGVIYLVVIAAIHRQLAGESSEVLASTFE